MSLKKLPNFFKTLAFRLSVWHTIFFISAITISLAFFIHFMALEYDRQIDVELLSDVAEIEDTFIKKGMDYVKYEVTHEAETEGKDKVFISVMDLKGNIIKNSDPAEWIGYKPSEKALKYINSGKNKYYETRLSDKDSHNIRSLYKKFGNDYIVWFSSKNDGKKRLWLIIRNVFQPALLIMIIFSAVGGWLLSKHSLQGINDITGAALEISKKGDIKKRLEIKNRGLEIETLSLTFNKMLNKIESLVSELKSTTDNMAHDLRNPVTRIRGAAEILLLGNREKSEFIEMCGTTIEECDDLLEMMNTMLDISEAEAGIQSPDLKNIDLSNIVCEIFELYEPVAETRKINFKSNIENNCHINGNIKLIQRMIANLIDNALKFTSEQDLIQLTLDQSKDIISFEIKDTGVGIKKEDMPHVFKKFYRGDKSRTGTGVGLGLSLVKIIAEQHNAKINLKSNPDEGTIFTITFNSTC